MKRIQMIHTSNTICSINVEDIQNVAEDKIGRKLSKKELKIVEDKVGDYIDWYGAIELSMQHLNLSK